MGLTATPRRRYNADTYAYFGEPVYVYSLKEGINDGYLIPFKVRQIATILDDYVYTADDEIIEGEIEEGRRYSEEDFNRMIEIRERERYRVRLFLEGIDPREKTLVFCARKALLAGLEERGYGLEQLREIGRMIKAEHSDLYDVLAYIAYAQAPVNCSERVDSHLERIFSGFGYPQQAFLGFVLNHYIERGVTELDVDKLPMLIELKYHSIGDAVAELGSVAGIREVFVGFQRDLY